MNTPTTTHPVTVRGRRRVGVLDDFKTPDIGGVVWILETQRADRSPWGSGPVSTELTCHNRWPYEADLGDTSTCRTSFLGRAIVTDLLDTLSRDRVKVGFKFIDEDAETAADEGRQSLAGESARHAEEEAAEHDRWARGQGVDYTSD